MQCGEVAVVPVLSEEVPCAGSRRFGAPRVAEVPVQVKVAPPTPVCLNRYIQAHWTCNMILFSELFQQLSD